MAKFTPGPAIAEARGSVGGTCFSRNRYGAYMRFRAKPVVSTTSYALAAKARLAAGTTAWQALTDAQRNAWTEWAAQNPSVGSLGEQQILTGHVAYVGTYCRALIAGGAPLTQPPITPAPAPLTSLVLTADIGIGGFTIAFAAAPTGAAEKLYVRGCTLSSGGVNYVENYWRFIVTSGLAEATPFDIETAWNARLGTPQVGQTCHVSAAVLENDTFQLSTFIRHRAVVVST